MTAVWLPGGVRGPLDLGVPGRPVNRVKAEADRSAARFIPIKVGF